MDETKLTAHLPAIDVEITRRTLPDQNAEGITIHITATPSFDAARWLLLPFASPFLLWGEVMRAWQPFLLAGTQSGRALPKPAEKE
ncbi:hypothetical protein AWB67_02879 [Caballeronia terrestris]|jgi:hypothetical protein|uniref:Uncharacterized protein n=1 Tax=Caballeronia terrestris TaxID=1226301 RepID=A0A158ITH5_9BURK|nr:hypothetical protein [Caballeronia terrestris]SAL59856.1 hypothetical protein AWB67_02879 [Caballeronia terrestris]